MRIQERGIVTKIFKGNMYEVVLQDMPEHKVMARLCGKMRMQRIGLEIGDEVKIELSPYDLKRGRVVWRH